MRFIKRAFRHFFLEQGNTFAYFFFWVFVFGLIGAGILVNLETSLFGTVLQALGLIILMAFGFSVLYVLIGELIATRYARKKFDEGIQAEDYTDINWNVRVHEQTYLDRLTKEQRDTLLIINAFIGEGTNDERYTCKSCFGWG